MTTELDIDEIQPIEDALPLLFRETAQSYLGRLTAYYGYPTMLQFCRDFGLDARSILLGEAYALRCLSALTGCDAEALARWTPVQVTPKVMRVGTVEFDATLGPKGLVKQCVVCAREAIAAKPGIPPDLCLGVRAEWVVGYIDVCDHHRVRLTTRRVRKSSDMTVFDVSLGQASLYTELEDLETEVASPTDFEAYALKVLRCEAVEPTGMLAGIGLNRLVRICKHLGDDLALLQGRTEVENRQLLEMGFKMLAGGPESMQRLFEELRPFRSTLGWQSDLKCNIIMYLAATSHADIAPFKHWIYRLAFNQDATAPTPIPTIDAVELASGRFVSAMQHYQVQAMPLMKLVERRRDLQIRFTEDRKDLLVDRVVADTILTGEPPYVSRWALSPILGRDDLDGGLLVDILMDCGAISRPVIEDGIREAVPLFSLPKVLAERDALLSRFRRVQDEPGGLMTMKRACICTRVRVTDLLRLIMAGRVRSVAVVEGRTLMDSFRVDPREIFHALFGTSEVLTLTMAGEELGIGSASVMLLMDHGHLQRLASSVAGIESALPGLTSQADLKAFGERYIGLTDACNRLGVRSAKGLSKLGVEPAIDIPLKTAVANRRVIFFDRAEIMRRR